MSDQTREAQAFERKAQRLEVVADWFTDCENLRLESLPAGLISDLCAGASALRAQSALVAALQAIVEHEQIDGIRVRYNFDFNSPLGQQARAALALVEKQP